MMHPTKLPAPTQKRVVLRSAGFEKLRFTIHHYSETRLTVAPDGKGQPSPAYEHVFKCFETGVERRYGLEYGPGNNQVDDADVDTDTN